LLHFTIICHLPLPCRPLIENKDKIVLASASSAYKHALQEVLATPAIASRIKNTMASREVGCSQDVK
jgi:protein pelota